MEEEKRENIENIEEGKPGEAQEEKPLDFARGEEQEQAQEQEKEEARAEEKEEEKPVEEEKKEEEKAPEEKTEEKVEVKEEEAKEEIEPVGEKEKEQAKEEEEEKAEAEAEAEEKAQVDKKWYVIQTFTGQEDKVKQAIEQTIESQALKEKVFQVLVPTEEIVEIKGGKRFEKVKKMFPGYVFLEMVLDEESWYLIRQTPGVARFIGTKVRPTPVSDREMARVLKQLGKEERLEITFEKGEGVRVISGPFRGYTGTVDEVNPEKGKLKVLINIFGRDTPVEVNFEHAQKIV